MRKEKYISHLKNEEDRYVAMKTLNKLESMYKSHCVQHTDFYNPYEIQICIPILDQMQDMKYNILGGYREVERQIIVMYPDYMSPIIEEDIIGVVKISGKFYKKDVTHRDFLGAILGLGLKREKIGDIILSDETAFVIVCKELIPFICMNLEKISKYKVTTKEVSFEEVTKEEESYKMIHATVASLRLDAILAVGFKESRSAISKNIHNDRIKVNHKPIHQPSYVLSLGDVISFRGKGRIILDHIGMKSKKDRIHITVKRMI